MQVSMNKLSHTPTKGEAKKFLADVYLLMNEGREVLWETGKSLKDSNDQAVIADYASFVEEAMLVLSDCWRESINIENGKVVFRFPDTIRTDDGSSTVFSRGEFLIHMINKIDGFGKEFGLELGLRKKLNTKTSYQLFHNNGKV